MHACFLRILLTINRKDIITIPTVLGILFHYRQLKRKFARRFCILEEKHDQLPNAE